MVAKLPGRVTKVKMRIKSSCEVSIALLGMDVNHICKTNWDYKEWYIYISMNAGNYYTNGEMEWTSLRVLHDMKKICEDFWLQELTSLYKWRMI